MILKSRCARCLRDTDQSHDGTDDGHVPMGYQERTAKPVFLTPRVWRAAASNGARWWWYCEACGKDTQHISRGIW